MSRTDLSRLEQIALQVPCELCEAGVGTWCYTSNGSYATQMHVLRLNPVCDAWSLGYVEAEHWAARMAPSDRLRHRCDSFCPEFVAEADVVVPQPRQGGTS